MSTTKQIAANRANALKSSGPKSAIGKSVSSTNALKHGLLSKLPVLPYTECEADWRAHYAQVCASLQPVGYLEVALAERVALLLWKTARVARQEMAWTMARQNEVGLELPTVERVEPSQEHEGAIASNRQSTALIERLCHDSDDCTIKASDALELIEIAVAAASLNLNDDEFNQLVLACGGAPPEAETWIVAQVRRVWIAVATRVLLTLQELCVAATWWLANDSPKTEAILRERLRCVERARRQNLLPEPARLDLLIRYETHLERGLSRALNEIQRLQALRLGLDAGNWGQRVFNDRR